MSMSQLGRINSFQNIAVCPADEDVENLCMMMAFQEPGTTNVSVQCMDEVTLAALELMGAKELLSFPTLSQYNEAVPRLAEEGFSELCRSAEQAQPGRYALFSVYTAANPAPTPPAATPAVPTPSTPADTEAGATSDATFNPCNPMIDNWKRTAPMAINDAGATYLADIIPSIDGCSTPGPNDTVVYKFSTDPLMIGMAIDRIKADIADNKLPEGVDAPQANALIDALEQIRKQDQAYVAQSGLDRQIGMQERAIYIQIATTVGATGLSVGVISYFFYKQLKVSQQMLAQNKALIEERAGVVTNPLEAYARNLNEEFTSGRMEPVNIQMRNSEIQQARTALMMDRSVVFTGPAGVGKTAVVEAIAAGIEQGLYPELKGTKIYMLDLNAMEAGTKYRGSFEERLQAVIDEVAKSRNNGDRAILFVDELHRLMGTGAAENTQGAAQVLKTPLARGEIVIIGATTDAEFQQHIATDAALDRRFSKVYTRPLTAQETIIALSSKLSKIGAARNTFPEMRITPEALAEVVRLADKYIPNENFPAKADSLLKEAVAHKRLSCAATDPALATELTAEDVRNFIEIKLNMSVPPNDDDLPPGAAATGGSPSPAPAPDGSPSAAKFSAIPANLPIIIDGVPVVEEVTIRYGDAFSPRVVEMATPEGYTIRAIAPHATVGGNRYSGTMIRATPGSESSSWMQFRVTGAEEAVALPNAQGGRGVLAFIVPEGSGQWRPFVTGSAFNVGIGVAGWGLIHFGIEPAIGRDLGPWEKLGVYGGTGVTGAALLSYLAGTAPQWGQLIAGVPAGFAGFLPIGYAMAQSEAWLGINPNSPNGELIILTGGGILAAAGSTATLPAGLAAYFGVSTAAEAGLTATGVGLGIGTGVATGGALIVGVAIGIGIDEGLGELGVCNSDGSDCSLTGYLGEKMAETWDWCPDDISCYAPWNWFF